MCTEHARTHTHTHTRAQGHNIIPSLSSLFSLSLSLSPSPSPLLSCCHTHTHTHTHTLSYMYTPSPLSCTHTCIHCRCPYLHRTAGDTERRYHLRYYKTSTCVYETDSRGYCVKNGPHCAFAHGPHDLRPPVYDIREFQMGGDDEDRLVSPLVGSLERERGVLVDDPRWQGRGMV